MYSGIKQHFLDDDWFSADDNFGGGYIDSYGYDCIGPYKIVTQGGKPFSVLSVRQKKDSTLPMNVHFHWQILWPALALRHKRLLNF